MREISTSDAIKRGGTGKFCVLCGGEIVKLMYHYETSDRICVRCGLGYPFVGIQREAGISTPEESMLARLKKLEDSLGKTNKQELNRLEERILQRKPPERACDQGEAPSEMYGED